MVIKAEVVQLAGRAPQDNPRFVVMSFTMAATTKEQRAQVACWLGESRVFFMAVGRAAGTASAPR